MAQHPAYHYQDHDDGLIVANAYNPPEVVEPPTYPEVVYPNYTQLPHDPYPEAVPAFKEDFGVNNTLQPTTAEAIAGAPANPAGNQWSRRRWIIVGTIIAVVIVGVAVGVGCGVAFSKSKTGNTSTASDSSLNTSSTTTTKSVCAGTVCPQIFAAALAGSPTPSSLAVFARGTDNSMWYATADTGALETAWPGDGSDKWQSLGGGPFLSQPGAAAWEGGGMLTVAAVADPDHSTNVRTFNATTALWNDTWENVGGFAQSAVSPCQVLGARLDLWVAAYDVVKHNYWVESEADLWAHSQGAAWQNSADFQTNVTARPAVVCRDDNEIHDILAYGDDGIVVHSIYLNSSSAWTERYTYGSGYPFQGDPVLVEYDSERVDFFGVGTNGAMYHFSYSDSGGHSSMECLGGSFESVASAAVTGTDRIDVVALGTNHTLLHRVWQGDAWSAEWEDLGVFGNSAPLLVSLDTSPAKVAVLVLGAHGEVNQTTWTESSEASWQGLSWSSMGGNLTSRYYQS